MASKNETNLPFAPTIPSMKLPSIPFPTLPPLTMPPSFQRLLGITTTATPIDERQSVVMSSDEYQRKRGKIHGVRQESIDDNDDIERGSPSSASSSSSSSSFPSMKHLRSVSDRLPKFVESSSSDDRGFEKSKTDWMVPF
ncbi:unnamed protein product, partial [Mesorhabditis belari]|uniref:Uncharacterized protein n=1 Tax=Mesorhabditis belari TaxID=2138241 RepID=A0AAF3EZX1_9BILA